MDGYSAMLMINGNGFIRIQGNFTDEMRGGVSVEDVDSHNLDWKNKLV